MCVGYEKYLIFFLSILCIRFLHLFAHLILLPVWILFVPLVQWPAIQQIASCHWQSINVCTAPPKPLQQPFLADLQRWCPLESKCAPRRLSGWMSKQLLRPVTKSVTEKVRHSVACGLRFEWMWRRPCNYLFGLVKFCMTIFFLLLLFVCNIEISKCLIIEFYISFCFHVCLFSMQMCAMEAAGNLTDSLLRHLHYLRTFILFLGIYIFAHLYVCMRKLLCYLYWSKIDFKSVKSNDMTVSSSSVLRLPSNFCLAVLQSSSRVRHTYNFAPFVAKVTLIVGNFVDVYVICIPMISLPIFYYFWMASSSSYISCHT